MVMSWSSRLATQSGCWGLTRSKLLLKKYYTNNLIKIVSVQKIFVTYSINTEIRKCECIELNIFGLII